MAYKYLQLDKKRDGYWVIAFNYKMDDNRVGEHSGPFSTKEEARKTFDKRLEAGDGYEDAWVHEH